MSGSVLMIYNKILIMCKIRSKRKRERRFLVSLVSRETSEIISELSKEQGYSEGEILDIIVKWYLDDCEKDI